MTPLQQERKRRNWTKVELAREIERLATQWGVGIATRNSLLRMIAQYENGYRVPDEPYRGLFCTLYGRSVNELGLQPKDQHEHDPALLKYHSSLSEAVAALLNIARQDVDRSPGLLKTQHAPDALESACLDWLFGTTANGLEATGAPIEPHHVDELRAMTQTFDALDRQYGGDHSRELAARFLHDRVAPRLRGPAAPAIRTEYFQAASVLTELIGWMAYDSDRHGVGQRYFVQALRLADAAGDRAYGGYVLTSMSDQALYLRQPQQALRLAQAAYRGVAQTSAPAVATEAALLEARAHAALGNATEAQDALTRADQAYAQVDSRSGPTWAVSFGEVVFASHVGTCWADLGQASEAETAINVATAGVSPGQSRRRVFGLIQRANVALLRNEVDAATSFGTEAANITADLHSARSRRHVHDLIGRMRPWASNDAVRQFEAHARALLPLSA